VNASQTTLPKQGQPVFFLTVQKTLLKKIKKRINKIKKKSLF